MVKDWEYLFRKLKTLNWVILLVLASLSYCCMTATFTLGIIVGGFIIMMNFHVFQRTIRKGFTPSGLFHGSKASIIGKYYLRLAALGVIIYLLIGSRWVHPVGLAIGLSIVVIGIVGLGIIMVCTTSREAL